MFDGSLDTLRSDSHIVLSTEDGPIFEAVDRIDTLWTSGRATGKGALYGAAIGGIALTLGITLASAGECDEGASTEGCAWLPVFIAGSALSGAAVGALIGAVIGSNIKVWQLEYTRGPVVAEVGVDPALVGIAGRVRVQL
jgi:hypothetical protein